MSPSTKSLSQPLSTLDHLSIISRAVPSGRRSSQTVPHVPLATRFGSRLRSLRYEKGMTQLQVALEFGIDRTFISDLERGRKSVSLPFLEVFALGFGLSLSELLDQI